MRNYFITYYNYILFEKPSASVKERQKADCIVEVQSSKFRYYYYDNDDPLELSSTLSADGSSQLLANQKLYMEESTATVDAARVERSVIYQLKCFGGDTHINPLQLPANINIISVASSASHFLAVTLGKT